jgi:PAS domain S-box-containing protein
MTNATNEAEVFKTITDEAPDAVIWADAEGIMRYWNRGAEELFGWSAGEALGQSMDMIIPENLRDRHWEGYHRVMGGGESRYGRHELLKVPALRSNGSRVSIEFTLQTAEHPEYGTIAVAVLRDASEAFAEMRALRKRLAELEAGTAPA